MTASVSSPTRAASSEAGDWLAAARERVGVYGQYDRDFVEQTDVVVVGSGPCGAVANSLAAGTM